MTASREELSTLELDDLREGAVCAASAVCALSSAFSEPQPPSRATEETEKGAQGAQSHKDKAEKSEWIGSGGGKLIQALSRYIYI